MSIGVPVAADIPGLFDVIINGKGYIFLRTIDTSLPFRTQRAKYSRTSTFVERTNVSGAYSDNQQDFFLTSSQNDWSGGGGERFLRVNDPSTLNRFYLSSNMDVSIPGQATLKPAQLTVTFAAAISSICGFQQAPSTAGAFFAAGPTNLYEYDLTQTITSRGAHGAGAVTSMCTDGKFLYICGPAIIVKYNTTTHAFSTFNNTVAATWITFLNNALWAVTSTGLVTFDTAGVATNTFTWKGADGTGEPADRIIPFGGQLAILFSKFGSFASELWVGDNTGSKRMAELPRGFTAYNICQSNGVIFIIGSEKKHFGVCTAIYYVANGTIGKLWSSDRSTLPKVPFGSIDIVPYQGGLFFTDYVSSSIMFYDLVLGSVYSVASWTGSADVNQFANTADYIMLSQSTVDTIYLYDHTNTASTGYIATPLMDFDSSLTKQIRGVKVDFSAGGGGTVDVSYQMDTLDGAYTSAATGVTSGQEVSLSGVSGRSISVKVTLNAGGTSGPILKRVYVRASPVLQAFRECEYIIDCSGRKGASPVILNDGETPHPLDGQTQASNLNTDIAATAPFTIVDTFGSYTGIIEPGTSEVINVHPDEFIVRIATREV